MTRGRAFALVFCVFAGACAAPAAKKPSLRAVADVWSTSRTAGVTVTASAPKGKIERSWLDRMLILELQRSNLFAGVVRVPEEAKTADLLIQADITRIKRNNRYLKLYVSVRYVDGKNSRVLSETAVLARSDVGAKGLRNHHRSAGQAGKDIARSILRTIRQRR